jgi:hypothetical protein
MVKESAGPFYKQCASATLGINDLGSARHLRLGEAKAKHIVK